MYEHPYLTQKVAEFDLEQLQRTVERRRFIAEHADQIVPRPAGPLQRLRERMLRRRARSAEASAPSERRAVGSCEPAAAR